MVSFESSVFAPMSTVAHEKETQGLNSITGFIQRCQAKNRCLSTSVCFSRETGSL